MAPAPALKTRPAIANGGARLPASSAAARPPNGESPQRTVGPVSDLERHLPSDWWRTLFNALYLKTDGDVVNDDNTRREVSLLIRATGIEPEDRILDLCCGQGRHTLELARRGYRRIEGLDRSRYLIRLARRRARQNGVSVTFHEGDARKFRLPANAFQCVAILGNSFGYFDREEDDLSVLHAAQRVLRPGGVLVLDAVDGDWMREHYEPRSWEWIDPDQFACRERSLSEDGSRLITRELVVHAEHGVIADQFYAERLYSRAQISALLERAGFVEVTHHPMYVAGSDREQDLGMMGHRMFLTARAPQRSAPSAPEIAVRRVTVILGDPILPDRVKRQGQFNAEDFETIARLQEALREIPGYTFRYLNRHATLWSDLRAEPPDLVLNLCDEGYRNDAFQELHIPALLEMLAIPYTGAGPTALGLCYNKALVRAVAAALEIPVPLETYFDRSDQAATLPSAFPVLVKPNYGDSSIGITQQAVVHSSEELVSYLEQLRVEWPEGPVLIQEFLPGAEYSVGVLGNPGQELRALPVLEVDYSRLDASLPRLLGYESKWEPASPYWNDISYREARVDEETQRRLMDYSFLLFERLGCRDYARFDFRTDAAGEIKLLEANPNPGWCWDGKLNLMGGLTGLTYTDLLAQILQVAEERLALNSDPRA